MPAIDSALYPPNFDSVRDEVTVQVLTRKWPTIVDLEGHSTSHASRPPPTGDRPMPEVAAEYAPTTRRRREQPQTADQKGNRMRERNRVHQARYKTKQRGMLKALEDSVVALREEVEQLQVHRQLLANSTSTSGTAWGVVTEYFRFFQTGVKAVEVISHNSLCSYKVRSQQEFLLQTMTPDVKCGSTQGVDAMLEGWRLVSLYNGDIDIRLVAVEVGTGRSLIATTKVTHRLNETALHNRSHT